LKVEKSYRDFLSWYWKNGREREEFEGIHLGNLGNLGMSGIYYSGWMGWGWDVHIFA